ncbi:cellulase family glycosylhydrolase [Belnapia sp. T18]|uniref:Cellulase family glycosylhydrolase n=1 Tax=Belnapia arida TaxID=2804533 RepID=A0ABS1U4M0_9PROT|nr:cellulase family glycosylhydrolase [Belnapia arida]MBL6079602.1 cellulase family glycosylhydrolase [Belnapia arida]
MAVSDGLQQTPCGLATRSGLRLLGVIGGILISLLASAAPSRAEAPPDRMAMLARGINVAHWFRFPPDGSTRALRNYMDDAAIASLKRLGFTYVRLAVGPEVVMRGDGIASDKLDAIISAIERFQKAGLAVMVEPHPQNLGNWNLQTSADARRRLLGFWRDLAPALAHLPPALTFPEVVNEPMFADPAQWDRMQGDLVAIIRAALPRNTIVLAGADWSSINGLLRVKPVADRNVVYTFHTYEPQVLTLLASWEQGVDTASMGKLPFPVTDQARCRAAVAGIQHQRTRDIANYWCSERHDATTIAANLNRAVKWGRDNGVSVALTEFGAVRALNEDSRNAYLEAVRQAADQARIGWGLWALEDSMGFAIQPGRYSASTTLSPAVLRALGLPPASRR